MDTEFPQSETNPERPRDGDAFLETLRLAGALTKEAARRVVLASEEAGTRVEQTILELGLLEESTIYQAMAMFLGVEYVTLAQLNIDLLSNGPLKPDYMKRSLIIPITDDENSLLIAIATLDAEDDTAALSYMFGKPVQFSIATPTTIKTALDLANGNGQQQTDNAATSDIERLQALANDGPIISLVNDIIGKAVAIGASDIHMEAQDHGMRVRYRVDGMLQTDRIVADDLRSAVTSRLKVMGNLNISEKRRPQDGRVDTIVRGRAIDIRMSTLPTQHGESIVLRVLDKTRMQLNWDALGFPPERVAQIEEIMASPNGIFLVAGPTGSGKTTTLFTALRGINTDDRKVVTVEDPIEYVLEGANQVQVDTAVEMTFATALRAILRQDPNVVMVGEIRDEETAEIAVRAALVGRLVLSTIHTNDAIGAVDRLLDLGVAPYLLGATLRGVLAQRLVQVDCVSCEGCGCEACNGRGRQGRKAVSDLLRVSPDLANAIAQGARGTELTASAQHI